jgi:transcriptional regulator with XRE-family HTH domain
MANSIVKVNQTTANLRLKELREGNEFTQEQLAEHLAIEQTHLKEIEAGHRPFTPNLVDEICELFACSKAYLFGYSDELITE